MTENFKKTMGELLYCYVHCVSLELMNNGGILLNLDWIKARSELEINHKKELELSVQEYRIEIENGIIDKINSLWLELIYTTGKPQSGKYEFEFEHYDLKLNHLNGKKIFFVLEFSENTLSLESLLDEINPNYNYSIEGTRKLKRTD